MAITKTIVIEKIEVVGEYRAVQVATDTVIKEDGTELSRSRHRHVLECGILDENNNFVDKDISGEDSEVQAIANVVWTQAVKDAWKAKLIANRA